MPLIEIDTVGKIGVIKDEESYRLDPTVWSDSLNVRCVDGAIQTMGGEEEIFGDLTALDPVFILPVMTPTTAYWILAGLTAVWVNDGATNTDITRAAGATPYTATHASDWNATVHGGIPILNNGIDVPQSWNLSTGSDLAALANWDSTKRAKVIRSLGPHLIAIHLTESGVVKPHKVLWSHPSVPGAVPSSWDPASASVDAGETELADAHAGPLLDMMALKGNMYLYKENSTWLMRYIGGRTRFTFDTFLEGSGILATRCVLPTGDGTRHLVVTQDDIIVHDGTNVESAVDKRMRKHFFSNLDPTYYRHTFIVGNPFNQEMWVCFPLNGSEEANMALVWNYRTGTITEREISFFSGGTGSTEETGIDWASASDDWEAATFSWSNLLRRKTIVVNGTKALLLDSGTTWDGVQKSYRVQRVGLAIMGKKRDGSPIVDFNQRKMVTRVWPRLAGGPVNIRLGGQEKPEGSTTWTSQTSFDPSTQEYVDIVTQGRAVAIEFSSTGTPWRLEGYKLDLVPLGEY